MSPLQFGPEENTSLPSPVGQAQEYRQTMQTLTYTHFSLEDHLITSSIPFVLWELGGGPQKVFRVSQCTSELEACQGKQMWQKALGLIHQQCRAWGKCLKPDQAWHLPLQKVSQKEELKMLTLCSTLCIVLYKKSQTWLWSWWVA